jgi:uncharacterized membrane protein YkoI
MQVTKFFQNCYRSDKNIIGEFNNVLPIFNVCANNYKAQCMSKKMLQTQHCKRKESLVMKRTAFVSLILLMLVLLTSCGKISSDKAIDIALDELKLDRVTSPRIEATLDKSSSPSMYKVIIYQAYNNQIVYVDAKTGSVVSTSVEDANRN